MCDKKLKPLSRTAFPCSSFGTQMSWVEFELPALSVPREFALLVCFDPSQTRGIYLGRWAEPKAASRVGLPGRVQGKTAKGQGWMMRASCPSSLGRAELPERSRGSCRALIRARAPHLAQRDNSDTS